MKRVLLISLDEPLSDENGKKWERTILSPIDVYESRVTINTCYLFDYRLDPDRLAASLKTLLHLFPQIGSIIKKNGNVVYFDHSEPKLELVLLELDEEPDFSLAGNATVVACQKLPWPESVPYGAKTMIVTLTNVPNGRCCLGVSHNHALMGAGGLFNFMSTWSKVYRGINVANPSHNRSSLINADLVKSCSLPNEAEVLRLGYRYKTDLTAHKPADAPEEADVQKNEVFSIHYTLEDLENLKTFALSDEDSSLLKGKIVSSNDVMCANYLRMIAALRSKKIQNGSQIRFAIMVSWQETLKDILGPNYFGNTASNAVVVATIDSILNRGFSYSVNLIREAVSNYSRSDVLSTLRWLGHVQHERGLAEFERITSVGYEPLTELFVTSRAKFKMFDADFGQGEPIALQPATPPISGFSRVYPRRDGDGVDWLTCLSNDEYEVLVAAAKTSGKSLSDPTLFKDLYTKLTASVMTK